MFKVHDWKTVVLIAFSAVGVTAAQTSTAPNVTYTASGTFASPAAGGPDSFRLSGQPFSIAIVANSASVPTKHGAQWAQYNDLPMTGTVQSGLVPTPIAVASSYTDVLLATGNPYVDFFEVGTPLRVVGLRLTISAEISMPKSTIGNALIHPFTAPVALTPANARMTYSDGTSTTTLGVNGTLSTSLSKAVAVQAAPLVLHESGARVVTIHPDGTQSVRSAQAAAVDLGDPAASVALQFYVSGLGSSSDVRARVAGEVVPVLYAGPSGRFPGLDEVSLQLPRAMAGRGVVQVCLSANGLPSNSVGIRIR